MKNLNLHLTYASLFVLALGTMTSVSFSALSHILLVIPGLFYFYKDVIKKERTFELSLSSKFLLFMIVTIILSVIFNLDIIDRPIKNISKIKYFLIPFLGTFALNRLFENLTAKKIKVLVYAFLIASTVATISGIIGLYTGFNPIKMKNACHSSRACGLFGMYMTYGYGISLFCVLVSGILFYKNKVKELISPYFLWLILIINFIGLYLSYTRGGLLGFLIAVPFLLFKANKKKFVSFGLLAAILLGLSFTFIPKVKNMFANRAGSDMQRIAFYQTAYSAFKEKPLLGWGYRNFEPNVPALKAKYKIAYPSYGGHAHNNILEHLASTGLFGFLAVFGFFIAWLIETYKRNDIIGQVSFVFFISFFTSGLFQYTFGDGENLFLIMGVWMISQVGKFTNKKELQI
jgi:O-antigen ligase